MCVCVCACVRARGNQRGLLGRCELGEGKGDTPGAWEMSTVTSFPSHPAQAETGMCHPLPPEPSEVALRWHPLDRGTETWRWKVTCLSPTPVGAGARLLTRFPHHGAGVPGMGQAERAP